MSAPDYIERNLRLAATLRGRRLMDASRFTMLEPGGPLRLEDGPLLLQADEGVAILITIDEGKRNCLLYDASGEHRAKLGLQWYQVYSLLSEPESRDVMAPVLEHAVDEVDIIWAPGHPDGDSCMRGLRLRGAGGAVCIGGYLGVPALPSCLVLRPDELDPRLRISPLESLQGAPEGA